MPVGQPTRTTPMYSASIVTSDPVSGKIEAVIAGNLENVSVITTPVAFRWPVAGETWRIKNINSTWYLDEPYPLYTNGTSAATTTTASTTISTINPGDAVVNSPTGKVQVLGSSNGSTDFYLDMKTLRGARGSASFTGNSLSNIQVVTTHGLGAVPVFYDATPSFEGVVKAISATTTTFTVQFDLFSAAGLAGSNVTFASFGTGNWSYLWFACL